MFSKIIIFYLLYGTLATIHLRYAECLQVKTGGIYI